MKNSLYTKFSIANMDYYSLYMDDHKLWH